MIQKINEDKYLYYKIILFFISLFLISIFIFFKETELFHYAIAGKEWIKNGKIEIDPWFIKDGYKTYIQQWLYCIFIYIIFSRFDYIGIITIIFLTMFLFIIIYNKTLSLLLKKKCSFVIGLFAYSIIFYPNIRNEILTLILLLLQIYCIENYKKNTINNKKWLYFLPLITLLEINLHGLEYYFHFIFLLPYLVPMFFVKSDKFKNDNLNIKDFIIPIVLMICSLFINPYGYKLPILITKCFDVRYFEIAEFNRLKFGTFVFWVMMLLFLFLFVCLFHAFKNNKLTSTSLWFILGCGFLSLTAARNCKFFIFVLLFCIPYFNIEKLPKLKNNKFNTIGIIILSTFFSIFILIRMNYHIDRLDEKYSSISCPTDLVNYINENETKNVNIFTEEENGAYFSYYCNCKIMYQARTEMYYEKVNEKEDLAKLLYDIRHNFSKDMFSNLENKYHFDYIYANKDTDLYKYCKNKQYKEVVKTNLYSLFKCSN